MSRFFDLDSPFIQGLNKLADIILLNFLTIICSIPIITAGASVTAMHYVLLKIVRNEETYIIKSFFKSFKLNFKQATIIWLIELVMYSILYIDFRILYLSEAQSPTWLPLALIIVSVIVFMLGLHIFPLLSKFENSVRDTVKNSMIMGVLTLPKTVLMLLICAMPVVCIYFWEQQLTPILILVGVSGPGYLCALLYNKTFKRFEPKEEEKNPDEWHVEPVEKENDEF